MADQDEAKTKTIGFLPIEKVQTLPGWDDYLDKSIKLAALRTETQKAKNTVRQASRTRAHAPQRVLAIVLALPRLAQVQDAPAVKR